MIKGTIIKIEQPVDDRNNYFIRITTEIEINDFYGFLEKIKKTDISLIGKKIDLRDTTINWKKKLRDKFLKNRIYNDVEIWKKIDEVLK